MKRRGRGGGVATHLRGGEGLYKRAARDLPHFGHLVLIARRHIVAEKPHRIHHPTAPHRAHVDWILILEGGRRKVEEGQVEAEGERFRRGERGGWGAHRR